MSTPPITIALPIYNADRYLAAAIESLTAQTFADFEVIAVLDGCTDRSEEILMDLKDARFIVVKKERNEGQLAASNLTLERARGQYYGRMDSDDVADPRRLERQIAFLTEHPEIDVVGTWFDYIDLEGRKFKDPFPLPTSPAAVKIAFREYNAIGNPTALARTEKLRAIGGFGSEFRQAEDLALWLHCLAAGYQLANLPEVLLHYRVHPNQQSAVNQAEMFRLTNYAYQKYGPAIWGKDVPVFELTRSPWKRARNILRRLLQKLR